MKKFIVLYKRFERFWHWAQVCLIIGLILTGLEAHGIIQLFGFSNAIFTHNFMGFTWTGLLILIWTWILTSGEIKNWIPSFKGMTRMVHFYTKGVFQGQESPHHATPDKKFHTIQKLAYIGIIFGLLPLQVLTGWVFYFFPELKSIGYINQIDIFAIVHTLIAYTLMAFVCVHVYLSTFGKTLTTHIKAMITGREEVEQ